MDNGFIELTQVYQDTSDTQPLHVRKTDVSAVYLNRYGVSSVIVSGKIFRVSEPIEEILKTL